ncbi:hypothetical protein CPB84DRAFT_1669273 [Gymnopilus junonius]|uniref:DnaJ homologue subfamily C member 28 conserved domain-containing protein n=1 Tax=Gymnopilus junonius TaxID=109634 RepID=A0A9P5P430_GYMJU|nr:hypothetical protein CPB84DRAFT_1669273 [Gymnopilus junonius]
MHPSARRISTSSRTSFHLLSARFKPTTYVYSEHVRLDHNPCSGSQLTGSAKLLVDAAKEAAEDASRPGTSRASDLEDSHEARSESAQLSGSAKLFADAAKEEAEERVLSAKLSALEQEHENWTGEESMKDAVLRMLVDKYKPLRTGAIQTAEEKIKRAPPKLGSIVPTEEIPVKLTPTSGSWASEPLLKATEGHQPWHTQFKAPQHDVSSIKLADIPPVVSSKPSGSPLPLDDRERRMEREQRKRTEQGIRLTQAKESTLDYRMGIKGARGPISGRPNPVNMKGWTSLVEDRIEKARQAGAFNAIKGRGQPLTRSTDEHNPFIAREEFLMNRIIQRNKAAPPWVETQAELESSVNTFREILQQSWIRRAIRTLSMEHPLEILRKFTLQDIKAHRDPSWVEKEKSYHETAVAELNSLVRKYNGMAPYAVRRAYYSREAEINRLYDECAADILRQISEREENPHFKLGGGGGEGSSGGTTGHAGGPLQETGARSPEGISFTEWIRSFFRRWFGAGT